ncbi:MAG: hypothetical protein U5N86_06330 [Planctomycetota bacterium]|nr:hypothetical protein [Planctomycetota bacterium]
MTIAVNWSISGVTDSVAIEAPDRGTDYVEFGLADEHLVVIARFRGMEAKVPGSHLLVGRPVVRTTEKGVTVHMVSAGW